MYKGRHRHTETLTEWEGTDPERESTAERVQLKMGEHATGEAFHFLGEVDSPYKHIQEAINARVIDQPAAAQAIVIALEKSSVRPPGDNRPKTSIALLGPTGTGKTETARALAEALTEEGEEPNLIKIDCSAFSNGHEVASLVGSPPGYVGGDIEPLLSADNVEKPGTVILFDEAEKGHPKLHQLLLQVMDDGEITLSRGEVTNFRNTVVLFTSNAGAQEITKETSSNSTGFSFNTERTALDMDRIDQSAKNGFKKHFRPEFVNRLDDMVTFRPLSEEALHKVLDVKLGALNEFYKDEYQSVVDLSPATRARLVAQAAEEPEFGARPLVRALEQRVQAQFGRYIGNEDVYPGVRVKVYHRDELSDEHAAHTPDEFVFAAREDLSLVPAAPPATLADVSISKDLVPASPDHQLTVAEEIYRDLRNRRI